MRMGLKAGLAPFSCLPPQLAVLNEKTALTIAGLALEENSFECKAEAGGNALHARQLVAESNMWLVVQMTAAHSEASWSTALCGELFTAELRKVSRLGRTRVDMKKEGKGLRMERMDKGNRIISLTRDF